MSRSLRDLQNYTQLISTSSIDLTKNRNIAQFSSAAYICIVHSTTTFHSSLPVNIFNVNEVSHILKNALHSTLNSEQYIHNTNNNGFFRGVLSTPTLLVKKTFLGIYLFLSFSVSVNSPSCMKKFVPSNSLKECKSG